MDFIQISLSNLDGEAAEAVSEVFNRYGYGGAVMEATPPDFDQVTVRTIVPASDKDKLTEIEVVLALMAKVLNEGLPEIQTNMVGENDWAESWKDTFHVIRIGPRVVIQPSWRPYEARAEDVVVQIDPGLAFGSGLHPSTKLCLNILQGMDLTGVDLFDVGTGSGILSIAAAKMGAAPVRAVDVDDVAVRVARENFERNDQSQIEAHVGSAAAKGGRQWSLVVANILAHILIDIMADLKASLSAQGQLILSGIIKEQETQLLDCLAEHQLRIIKRNDDGDWMALIVGL